MIHARTVRPNAADLADVLDRVHTMHSTNARPWWACADPPYPARNELDRMMVQKRPPLTLVIAETDGGELVGYDFHDPQGVLLAGFVRHHESHQGYVGAYDEWALDIQRAMNAEIRRNTGGTIYHVTYTCPAIWHGLEVVLGIPQAPPPYPQAPGPTPTSWPEYAGPPPPVG